MRYTRNGITCGTQLRIRFTIVHLIALTTVLAYLSLVAVRPMVDRQSAIGELERCENVRISNCTRRPFLSRKLGIRSFDSIFSLVFETQTVRTDLLIRLHRLNELSTLVFVGCVFGERDLQAISEIDSIRSLIFIGCNITDDDCAKLKSLSNLTCISLNGTEVTNVGLFVLAEIPTLSEIEVNGTDGFGGGVRPPRIDVNGIREIRKRRPDVAIRFGTSNL